MPPSSNRAVPGRCRAAPPPRVGLTTEFGFGAAVGRERVRVVQVLAERRVLRGRRHQFEHRRHRAARQAARKAAHDHAGVEQLTRVVLLRAAVQREHGQIRRDGIKSARMHDARPGVCGLLVVQVDAFEDEVGFTGEIGVIGSGRRAGRHQRKSVLCVRADGGHHHPGALRHGFQRFRRRRVGGDDGPGLRGLTQRLPDGVEALRRSPGECDTRRAARERYSAVNLPTNPVAP